MVKTSLIKKLDKSNIEKIIFFNKYLNRDDAHFLKNEFDINSNDLKHLVDAYRNVGLVFKLTEKDKVHSYDWSPFINKVIIKNDIMNKFENVFVSSDAHKILLLTTKRLLKIDIDKLNDKIVRINGAISTYNIKVEKEKKEIEHELDM